MFTLVNGLILFFILLVGYQIILANHKIEGLENNDSYQPYDSNSLILAQQNAGNIEYIKQRIDGVESIFKQVQDLSGNVQDLQEQMNQLVDANQQYTTQMIGSTPPEITGTETEDISS
jgi:hypothetical protein